MYSKKNGKVCEGHTVSRDYYTLVSQTVLKQLQTQPLKHACTRMLDYEAFIYHIYCCLKWSKIQHKLFIHKLHVSFEERHWFFQNERPYKIRISPLNMQCSLFVQVWPFFSFHGNMKACPHTVWISKLQVPTRHAVRLTFCIVVKKWKGQWLTPFHFLEVMSVLFCCVT